jgi:tetratricopeptide (TPR) repeat protein
VGEEASEPEEAGDPSPNEALEIADGVEELDADEVEELDADEVEVVAPVPTPPPAPAPPAPPADPSLGRWLNASGKLPTPSEVEEEQAGLLWAVERFALETLRQPRRALKAVQELLRRRPSEVSGWTALATLFAGLERWGEHIEALLRRAELEEALGDPARGLELRREVAGVYEHKLYRLDKAAEAWEAVGRAAPALGVTLELGRLYARLERWDEA